MLNFEYFTPTKIYFGKGVEERAGKLVRESGGTRVLVHFGGESARKSGLLSKVFRSLSESGIGYVELGGVVPNPRLSKVYEGVELCRKEGIDFILAVGGGSVIDSAKAIGYGVLSDRDVWDFYERRAQACACLPIGAIPTIAAAGSEMSDSSVITKEEGGIKRGYSNDVARCKFALLNPELTFSLPPYQTANGLVDILMHTMERYFHRIGNTELTDRISEGLMKTVINNAPIVMNNPCDYNARAEIMWAGSLSHNDLTGGRGQGDWACHQLEHELSGMFDVAHGAGLAAIWGSWARYVFGAEPSRFAQFAVNVMGVENDFSDPSRTALKGIVAMENFYRSINMPVSISDLGISLTNEQVAELADKCSFQGTRTVGHFRELFRDDMEAIYSRAR